jgi:hypothetical protein
MTLDIDVSVHRNEEIFEGKKRLEEDEEEEEGKVDSHACRYTC